ncbi:MAG TPA: SDR family NAD(P)-dependent oxidoreductase [Burkholderiales bacterium]|nr:SDR family NAD(P)-dependent oxidoreductase [Burkholderiales bacterium]
MGEFTGKVVVITGAVGNLGQACAQAFARVGAKRALVDRSSGRLAPVYPASAETLLIEGIDLAEAAHAAKAVAAVLARFGRVDVWVNTVGGFAGGKKVHEDGLDLWEHMQRINLLTTLNACRAVVPSMLKQGGGRIVNVGARAALTGVAGLGAYGASKSAVIYLTQTLAAELKDQGVNVNCVLPGTIDTPQNRRDMPQADFSKWVAPAAIADAILFLASGSARAVTGAALPVYGRS